MLSNIKEIQRKKQEIMHQNQRIQHKNIILNNKKNNEQLSAFEEKRNSFLFCKNEQHNHKEDIISNKFEYIPEVINSNIRNFEQLPLSFSLL